MCRDADPEPGELGGVRHQDLGRGLLAVPPAHEHDVPALVHADDLHARIQRVGAPHRDALERRVAALPVQGRTWLARVGQVDVHGIARAGCAGQVQGLPPLLDAEPGKWLAVLTDAEAYQVRLWRELRDVEQELKGK